MQSLDTIHDYLRTHSDEIGKRILSSYPALHGADEGPSPLLSRMVRTRHRHRCRLLPELWPSAIWAQPDHRRRSTTILGSYLWPHVIAGALGLYGQA